MELKTSERFLILIILFGIKYCVSRIFRAPENINPKRSGDLMHDSGKPRASDLIHISQILGSNDNNTDDITDDATELLQHLENFINNSEQILPADVNDFANILGNFSDMDDISENIIDNIANAVEQLMERNEFILEMDYDISKSWSSITKSFENILSKSIGTIRIDKPSFYAESIISQTEKTIGISVTFNNSFHFQNKHVELLQSNNFSVSPQTAVALILPTKHKKIKDADSRMNFIVYNDSRLFPVNESTKYINSFIISATVKHINYTLDSSYPVQLFFQPIQMAKPMEYSVCVFWNYSLNGGLGAWSEEGCWLDKIRNGKIICLCTHLTHFAVLLEIRDEYRSSSFDHTFNLSIITYFGCALSILGLSLTILTFALFKTWRKKLGNKVLCNFSISLLLVLVTFLVGFEEVSSPRICISVAVLLHYFILVAFGWMLVEGVLHYLLFVRIFNSTIPRFMMKSMILAWGFPMVIVATVLCIDVDLYKGSTDYCWMSHKAVIYAFLLPIGVIIFLNTVLFTLVIKSISCDRKKICDRKTNNFTQIYAAICILLLLGLTWVFGFFAVHKFRIFFQYLFCICNSLQGFLIFAFMLVRDNNAQDLWMSLVLKRHKHSTTVSSVSKQTKNATEKLRIEVRSI